MPYLYSWTEGESKYLLFLLDAKKRNLHMIEKRVRPDLRESLGKQKKFSIYFIPADLPASCCMGGYPPKSMKLKPQGILSYEYGFWP